MTEKNSLQLTLIVQTIPHERDSCVEWVTVRC